MSSPSKVRVGDSCLDAYRHLKEHRDVNTVVFAIASGVLEAETSANWTHDELLGSLPGDQPRLILHELPFATATGARRHELVLVSWMPGGESRDDAAYTAGYEALKELFTEAHVHLTARQPAHLAYDRLVALAD
ncbi:cofilin family protein [Streptomyces sp. NPDC047014]|uniref:cofilin family protein n=1 Tax=Streptomyces sp. NPDC047014 TaxID=3155736 RepID=UPI0033D80E08